MPSSASSIITRAGQRAKVISVDVTGNVYGYQSQALEELNDILEQIAQTSDFSAARQVFNFFFATNLVVSGAGNIVQAAANPLPLDYLRVETSGGSTGAQRSSKWFLQGVPYDMIELDYAEFYDQVLQPGMQSYPYYCTKDIAQFRLTAQFTGDLSTGSQTVTNVSSVTGISAGMSISGGIGPLFGIVPGTTIIGVSSAPTNTLTLSQAPALNQTGASLIAGTPATILVYPPPSGAFAARLPYQSLPPRLTQAQVTAGAVCWYPNDSSLIRWLAGRLMEYSDDTRQREIAAAAKEDFDAFLRQADDRANRAQTVQLDRRVFGRTFSTLRNTKKVGW